MNSSGGGVEREFADWNAHPSNAEIAKSKDAFVICHHDQSRLTATCRVVEELRDATLIIWCHPCAARAPPDLAPALARLTNCRRVHNREELLHVLCEQSVEERLIPILQRSKTDVALKWILLPANLLQLDSDLLFKRKDGCREESVEPKESALILGKRRVLIQRGAAQQRLATLLYGDRWEGCAHRRDRIAARRV